MKTSRRNSHTLEDPLQTPLASPWPLARPPLGPSPSLPALVDARATAATQVVGGDNTAAASSPSDDAAPGAHSPAAAHGFQSVASVSAYQAVIEQTNWPIDAKAMMLEIVKALCFQTQKVDLLSKALKDVQTQAKAARSLKIAVMPPDNRRFFHAMCKILGFSDPKEVKDWIFNGLTKADAAFVSAAGVVNLLEYRDELYKDAYWGGPVRRGEDVMIT